MIHASSSSMTDTNSQGVPPVPSRYASCCNGIQVLPPLTLTKDLKDRYYSICRKLVRNRPWNGDELNKTKILGLLSFEKGTQISTAILTQDTHAMVTERELTRKQYLRSLESRTPEQIAEEEALYLELKRLEQTERQFKKDRDDLLRTLLGIESGLSDIQLGDDSSLHGLSSMPEIKKSKKRTGSTVEIDSPSAATPSSSIMHFQKRIPLIKNAAYGMLVSSIVDCPCPSYCHRHATLYNAYRSSSNCGDEVLSPSGRPPIVQTSNSETGDGHEGLSNALRIQHQQFQARHAH